jgi:hypothetical protein
MRVLSTIGAVFAAAAMGAAAQPAAAQDIIIRTPPGVGVTVIESAPPPPAVVRPAPLPPSVRYYSSPGVDAAPVADGCAWLYRRASYTNDPYWWARYRDCVE